MKMPLSESNGRKLKMAFLRKASRFPNFTGEHAPRPPQLQGPHGPSIIVTTTYFSRVSQLIQTILELLCYLHSGNLIYNLVYIYHSKMYLNVAYKVTIHTQSFDAPVQCLPLKATKILFFLPVHKQQVLLHLTVFLFAGGGKKP